MTPENAVIARNPPPDPITAILGNVIATLETHNKSIELIVQPYYKYDVYLRRYALQIIL
jgi:hypothetical protein